MGSLIAPSSFLNQKCADFNGTNEYMYRNDPSFKADTAGAWSFWVKLDAVFAVNDVDIIIGYGVRSGANNSQFFFGPRRNVNTGTSTYMSIFHRATNGGTIDGFSGTTTALTAGAWTHVVVQSNGTAWSMWINGVSQTMTQWNGTGSNNGNWYGDVSGTDHRMTIGVQYLSNAIGANFYAGLLDEVTYLSGRVFTSGEVASLYNSGTRTNPRKLASIQADLETWYRMGDSRDSATTVFDELSGANDLTLVNMDASNYVSP
jgi:hypothetical protein